MTKEGKQRLAGAVTGVTNGLFGGGGGMVLLPLLTKWDGMEQKSAFAACVAAILPISCVSAAVYLFRVRPDLVTVLPYLLGGAVGGVISGLTFEKVPVKVLKIVFGLFLLYGGVRNLL